MKKYIIAILIVLAIFPVITVNATESIVKDTILDNWWSGNTGSVKRFDKLDDLLLYIENEGWQYESPTVTIYEKDKLDYLKRMDKELFLPVGYTREDIVKIQIDKAQVRISLADEMFLYYWFTSAGSAVDIIPGTNVGTPTKFWLVPHKNKKNVKVNQSPEVYNIYEADNSEDIDIDDPVECGDVETVPEFE